MTYLTSSLNRYILKTFFQWFAVICLGIGAIIFIFDIIEILRRMIAYPTLPTRLAFEIVCLRLLGEVQKMLPFIVLASSMMTFFSLNQRSELTVMRASGVSIIHILTGLSVGVFIFGLVQLSCLDPLRATFTDRLYRLEEQFFNIKRSTMSLQETGLWLKEVVSNASNSTQERILHASRVHFDEGVFDNPVFYIFDKNGECHERLDATEATLSNAMWILKNPVRTLMGSSHPQASEASSSLASPLYLPTHLTLQKIRESNAVPETLSMIQTHHFIKLLDKSGLSSLSYRMYYNRQIALIGFMVMMVFLAASFSFRPSRSSRSGRLIAVCVVTGLVFYFLNDFLYALGLGQRLSPLVATWALPVLGMLISLTLLSHSEERR